MLHSCISRVAAGVEAHHQLMQAGNTEQEGKLVALTDSQAAWPTDSALRF
ncbi:hypothetical protein [Cedecea sp. FDAARGOS_727]|nr:hypothetical protein [Cedecea sp. FDAARGOS_727]QIX97290.1 hypothetical protein FOC35_17080 [Cedecea sp. FDAARGOS_727]